MSIRGSLRTMSIQDVLDWIDNRRLVGHLTVERGDSVHAFHFDEGVITSASSNLPGEHLGQLLMSRGLVNETQLSEAFKVQADTGVFLGKVLLMIGVLSETALREVLELKVGEAICDILSWDGGRFVFEPGTRSASEFAIRVPLRTTLDLGVRQAKRWREVRALIPSDDLRFWIKDHFALEDSDLSEQMRLQERRIAGCIDRGLSVNQMVLEHHGRRFQVMNLLADLLSREVLAKERRSEERIESPSDPARDVESAARGRAAGGNKAEALEMTTKALRENPDSESLHTLHKELQRSLFAELSRELLSTFRVPKLRVSLEQIAELELSDHERYLASRIDGRWDLLSLMRISPLREVDALLTFKRLAERGIIEL